MMNRALSFKIHPVLKRSLVLGAFSSIAVLAGWAPNLSQPDNPFGSAASAQEPSFTRYVRAAVATEELRQPLEEQVRQLTGGALPRDVCRNLGQVSGDIRDDVKKLCQQFSRDAARIVFKEQKLSRDEFNAYQSQFSNRSFCERVAQEARRLQIGEINCKDAR
jgi:hypothetical protein